MVLKMPGQLIVALCLKTQMISKCILLIGLSIMGKEFVLSFALFVLLLVLRIIFIWGNFATCFFQSNDKCVYAFNTNIFVSNVAYYYFFTQSYYFLLKQHMTYLFYRFTQQIIFFYLDNCYIINTNLR